MVNDKMVNKSYIVNRTSYIVNRKSYIVHRKSYIRLLVFILYSFSAAVLIPFSVAVLALISTPASAAKTDKQVVTFSVDLHCQGCIDKIYKTIAYEKGVKDIQCDLDTKTVVVTYDASKTDIPTLQAAFAAINKPATVLPAATGTTTGTATTAP